MPLAQAASTLLHGAGVTTGIFAGAILVAIPCACAAGAARATGSGAIRKAAIAYVEVFRGTSTVVQLYWAYFALPFLGIRLDALTAAILVLGLNTGAYGAEVVRGAIGAIDRGQIDAARALGLTPAMTLRAVILPQALVVAMPSVTNLAIELLKGTALVSLIGLADLAFAGRVLEAATLDSAAIYAVLLVIYFVLASGIAHALRAVERRLSRWRATTEPVR